MINGKLKLILIYVGAAVGIYFVLKYLLPLSVPFLIAYLFAAMFNPVVTFLNKRLKFKRSIATVMVMIVAGTIFGVLIWWFGRVLIEQIKNVVKNYDYYYQYFNSRMCNICMRIDSGLGFEEGTALRYLDNSFIAISEAANETIMPAIMGRSFSVFKWIVSIGGIFVIFYMSVFFITKDYYKIKGCFKNSPFAKEAEFLKEHAGYVIMTYLKTQLIIISITTVVCGIGLIFLKNPYWLLLALIIGIVDALPIFGTGTILIPWAGITALWGNYMAALVLLLIYFVCYFAREYLEPKLMGRNLGIHPLIMLIAVYVGLILFGVLGVITGPIACMLIKEVMTYFHHE